MEDWIKYLYANIIIGLFFIVILIASSLYVLNIQIPVVQYNALTGKYLNSTIEYYGSSGSAFYGTTTVFDMLFNRDCLEITDPRTFNYDSQMLNQPYANTITNCGVEIGANTRWLDKEAIRLRGLKNDK